MSFIASLTCANNQGQAVSCPNGFCQLTRKGLSVVDRTCVPQGRGSNPSGIMISSNTMEGPETEALFVYACNKPMCNGAETDLKIRQALVQSGLLRSSYLSPSELTSPMTTEITTMTSRIINSNTTGITTLTSRIINSNITGVTSSVTTSGTNTPIRSSNTTTANTPTTSTNAATTTFRQTIINYQWMLFLIMTVFL